MATALFNPRGRLIWVKDREISPYLKRGFAYPPRDWDTSITYNHIYDKGHKEAKLQSQSSQALEKNPAPKVQNVGNILNVELI